MKTEVFFVSLLALLSVAYGAQYMTSGCEALLSPSCYDLQSRYRIFFNYSISQSGFSNCNLDPNTFFITYIQEYTGPLSPVSVPDNSYSTILSGADACIIITTDGSCSGFAPTNGSFLSASFNATRDGQDPEFRFRAIFSNGYTVEALYERPINRNAVNYNYTYIPSGPAIDPVNWDSVTVSFNDGEFSGSSADYYGTRQFSQSTPSTSSTCPTRTASTSQSVSRSTSISPSTSVTPTSSISVTATSSISITPTSSISITPTSSISVSPTSSTSVSASVSITPSSSISASPSNSPGASDSSSPTHSVSASSSPSISVSRSPSVSISVSRTPSASPLASKSRSASTSVSRSPTPSPSPTKSLPCPTPGCHKEKNKRDWGFKVQYCSVLNLKCPAFVIGRNCDLSFLSGDAVACILPSSFYFSNTSVMSLNFTYTPPASKHSQGYAQLAWNGATYAKDRSVRWRVDKPPGKKLTICCKSHYSFKADLSVNFSNVTINGEKVGCGWTQKNNEASVTVKGDFSKGVRIQGDIFFRRRYEFLSFHDWAYCEVQIQNDK
eukprot:TRINITY_DN423_c0_g1_i1.p1 TRINITY_DN423_c0_g1~~TRINITY_DN423_c0_g1_i1.p1  ORF type:complete len:553 (-),score=86.24 TRINITY_DN423_c0_g1_i1:58-1716(-)